jgi:hypothetical protein
MEEEHRQVEREEGNHSSTTTECSLDEAQRNPGIGVMVEQFPRISLRYIRATGSGHCDPNAVFPGKSPRRAQ